MKKYDIQLEVLALNPYRIDYLHLEKTGELTCSIAVQTSLEQQMDEGSKTQKM